MRFPCRHDRLGSERGIVLPGSLPAWFRKQRRLVGEADALCVAADQKGGGVVAAIFKRGGSAFDAAAAAGFMEAVISPSNCGIGGYGASGIGYLVAKQAVVAFDANIVAPCAARPDMFPVVPTRDPNRYRLLRDSHKKGLLSIGVSGVMAGLALLAERFGKLG